MAEESGTPVAGMSFEQALRALEEIVDTLESGRVELEKSIALYERGRALREHCEKKLADAELRVSQITDDGAGGVSAKPVEID
jgi:exodeoxyribonuclease VII small subunit